VRSNATDEKSTCDWISHWAFERAPFVERDSPYVSLPAHDDATLRLLHCIETGGRSAFLTADSGLGKSTVLRRVLEQARSGHRRCVFMSCPLHEDLMLGTLADRLGERLGHEPGRLACWRAIERSFRLASIQGTHLVIGIDDCETATASVRRIIESIANLWAGLNTQLTIIQAGRPTQAVRADRARRWSLAIRLQSLTRSEAERYLVTKLAAAGCNGPVFTPRAVTRIHCLGGGVPRAIEGLATRCLMAAAACGLDAIPPEIVDMLEENTEEAVATRAG
jgi:type II secretory pathway predicted ATPase ExeA